MNDGRSAGTGVDGFEVALCPVTVAAGGAAAVLWVGGGFAHGDKSEKRGQVIHRYRSGKISVDSMCQSIAFLRRRRTYDEMKKRREHHSSSVFLRWIND